jgi:ubiquinone/menaquinone biosynthesis C-methylase UbiE
VLDVGGGPGTYASWLAAAGYRVHLVDPVPLHVEQARETAATGRGSAPGFTAAEGDARHLDEEDASQDAVLLLGPLYHLTDRHDRIRALAEARRVLRPGGVVAAAAISRFASLLDGLMHGFLENPDFLEIVEQDLRDGQHRDLRRGGFFTTAYFHHPDELAPELQEAGFAVEAVLGIEGPGALLEARWHHRMDVLVRAARAVESEPMLIGASLHLLAVGRKTGGSRSRRRLGGADRPD